MFNFGQHSQQCSSCTQRVLVGFGVFSDKSYGVFPINRLFQERNIYTHRTFIYMKNKCGLHQPFFLHQPLFFIHQIHFFLLLKSWLLCNLHSCKVFQSLSLSRSIYSLFLLFFLLEYLLNLFVSMFLMCYDIVLFVVVVGGEIFDVKSTKYKYKYKFNNTGFAANFGYYSYIIFLFCSFSFLCLSFFLSFNSFFSLSFFIWWVIFIEIM